MLSLGSGAASVHIAGLGLAAGLFHRPSIQRLRDFCAVWVKLGQFYVRVRMFDMSVFVSVSCVLVNGYICIRIRICIYIGVSLFLYGAKNTYV